MIYEDQTESYTSLVCTPGGVQQWYSIYAVEVPVEAGRDYDIRGSLQVINSLGFDVEYVTAIAVFDAAAGAPLIRADTSGVIDDPNGSNITPDMKYGVARRSHLWTAHFTGAAHISIAARLRSTKATSASRIQVSVGEGRIQVRPL